MKRLFAIFTMLCMLLSLSSVSVWATEAAAWQSEKNMSYQRAHAASCTIENKIYILGGCSNANTTHRTVEIYDTQTNTWTAGTSMPRALNYLNAESVGNKIYLFGGASGSQTTDTVDIYDTQTDTWTKGTSMPTKGYQMSSSVVSDKIYLFGGTKAQAVDIYDTQTDTWTAGASMPTARKLPSASVVGDKVYVFGGCYVNTLDTVDIYDTQTDTWTAGASMPTARHDLSSEAVGDKIYVFGGYSSTTLNTVEIYDTQTNTWTAGPSMSTARYGLSSAFVDNKIYAIGGTDFQGAMLRTMESLNINDVKNTTPILSVLLEEGETVQLSISYNLADNANYTWSSTDESIASVDENGKVTAVAPGSAKIYSKNEDGTFSEYIPIKVVKVADNLRLAVHLKAEETTQLYLTDDSSQVTWHSMDEGVVTISSDGQITGIKKGLAIVQATLGDETYLIYVRVNG